MMQNPSQFRSQSAMEYLMTYGWAILIIAVVLGALYYLGVFNSSNLAPRAQPGSCKVVRPNGPGTTTYINLAGVCTGQLPLFVGSFDGQSSYIDVGNKAILNVITNDFTISMWLNSNGWSTSPILVGKESSVSGNPGWDVGVTGSDGKAFIDMNDGTWLRSMHIGSVLSINKWYQIVFVFSRSSIVTTYLNGVSDGSADISARTGSLSNSYDAVMGKYVGAGPSYFGGLITNMQLYNTSLSATEIQGLYAEGIGGAPTRLQNLVGWWPLNGNANDYSGNGNNGATTNVIYLSTWTK